LAFAFQSPTFTDAPIGRRRDLLLAALVAAVAMLIPFHRGLAFPFALDDYTFLFPAAGLEPTTFTLRRWLVVSGYYDLWLHLFGPNPLAWHLTSFVLHAANSVWVYLFARRFGVSREAAWLACGLFAASPLAFTVLYWSAGIQEIGSTFFLFTATWIALRADRWRWVSAVVFALAMLCKESVIAAPLVFLVVFGRRMRGLSAAMFVTGVALFLAAGLGGRMFDSDPRSPYATSYGATLLVNLATQFVWFLAPWRPYPDRIAGPQPGLVLPAVAVAGACVVAVLVRRSWVRLLGAAAAWFVALLLPVLPLRQHSYAYYAYAAQAGFLIVGAAAGLRLVDRLFHGSRRWRSAFAALAVCAVILFAVRNTTSHETLMLPKSRVPHDSVVRYGRAAGAIVAAVRDLPPDVHRAGFMCFPEELGSTAHTPGTKRPGMVRVRRFPLRDALKDGLLVEFVRPGMTGAWVDTLDATYGGPETALFFTSGFNTIERVPNLANAYVLQAQGRLLIDDRAGSRRDLEHALALDPNFTGARILLAGLETEERHPERARQLLAGLDWQTVPESMHAFVVQLHQTLGLPVPEEPSSP